MQILAIVFTFQGKSSQTFRFQEDQSTIFRKNKNPRGLYFLQTAQVFG